MHSREDSFEHHHHHDVTVIISKDRAQHRGILITYLVVRSGSRLRFVVDLHT